MAGSDNLRWQTFQLISHWASLPVLLSVKESYMLILKRPPLVDLKPTRVFETAQRLKEDMIIFKRDCHIRKLKPTFAYFEGCLICLETGDRWGRPKRGWKDYECPRLRTRSKI